MKCPSQRDRTGVILFGERRVVIFDRRRFVFPGARTHAACKQKCRDAGGEKHDAEHQAIDDAGRTEHHGGRAHQRVADDAAKSGRQRPRPTMRPAACKTRRYHGAEDPAADPQRLAVEAAMGQHAPAPDRDGEDQHDRAEAENLHQEIGADRAGIADDVADRTRCRVAEARILHRPCHQRRRHHATQRDQAKPCELT